MFNLSDDFLFLIPETWTFGEKGLYIELIFSPFSTDSLSNAGEFWVPLFRSVRLPPEGLNNFLSIFYLSAPAVNFDLMLFAIETKAFYFYS